MIFKSLQRSDAKMATADSKSVLQLKKKGPESPIEKGRSRKSKVQEKGGSRKSRKGEGPESSKSRKRKVSPSLV